MLGRLRNDSVDRKSQDSDLPLVKSEHRVTAAEANRLEVPQGVLEGPG